MSPLTLTAVVQPGGTITLNGLPLAAGDTVQVLVWPPPPLVAPLPEDPTEGGKYPLRGTPGVYIDPFEPACEPEDWEVLR